MPKPKPILSFTRQIASAPKLHDNSNPLWKGPCGTGPLGGITQSMLVRFLSCRERFRLKYVCGLEPSDVWNKSIGYGNMWHVCEEAHAANYAPLLSLMDYTGKQMARYPMQRDEIYKWGNICRIQFPEYVKYWSEHPDVVGRTPLMQEQVFDVPYTLPSGRVVRLRGKFDSVDLIDNVIWLQENKTKGSIDKIQVERQLTFDLQTMLYLVALGRFGNVQKDCPILGVRYNVVRRPLSGGVGNIKPHAAKQTKSEYTPAETDEKFYERLRRNYIAADPSQWFFRVCAEISERDTQVFRDTCLDPLLEQLCWWYEEITGRESPPGLTRYPPMNYRTPFGVYSALEENGATEYDLCLATGSEAGLRRVDTLFTEL